MSDGSELGAALARLFPGLPTGPEKDYRAVFDALQCAADVQTLDEWRKARPAKMHRAVEESNDGAVSLHEWPNSVPTENNGYVAEFTGATPEEARAKAAAWVREKMKGTKP